MSERSAYSVRELGAIFGVPPALLGTEPAPRDDEEATRWQMLYERYAFGQLVSERTRELELEDRVVQLRREVESTNRWWAWVQAGRPGRSRWDRVKDWFAWRI